MEKIVLTDEMYELLHQLDDANKKALKEPWNFKWQEQTFEIIMEFNDKFGFNFDENVDILMQYKARREAETSSDADDSVLKIGGQFPKELPGEVAFTMAPEPTLILNWSKISDKELNNIKNGDFKMRITYYDDITFILAKFSGQTWMDAPYSAWLDGDELPLSAILTPYTEIKLKIVLVEAETNKIIVIRTVSLDLGTSRRLISCAQMQMETEFNREKYFNNLEKIYRKFNTNDLVKMSIETRI